MDGTSDWTDSLNRQTSFVRRSSYIDTFLQDVWSNNPNWIQVYLGMPGNPGEASLFRTYPGSVREGLTDSSLRYPDGRQYDPVRRPWYTLAVAAAPALSSRDKSTQLAPPRVIVSAPYEDADGKGVLVSVSSAFYGGSSR